MLPWLASLLVPATVADTPGRIGLGVFAATYAAVVWLVLRGRCPRWVPFALAVLLSAIAVLLVGHFGTYWYLPLPFTAVVWSMLTVDRGAPLVNVGGVAVVHLLGWVVWSDWPSIVIGAFLTFLAGMLTFVVLRLARAQEELARTAVAEERLRFARDLHDLLGHTLSLVVVKAEVVRRLIPRDPDAAREQAADIESVGRTALTEVREAVTGYRERGLAEELRAAASTLGEVGIRATAPEPPPLPAATSALLAWVVREGVTNVLRHAAARRCVIGVSSKGEHVELVVADDGRGAQAAPGNGLRGLTERVQAAGGELRTGPGPLGGFALTVTLPVVRP